MNNTNKKRALVTGASSGFGLAIVKMLLKIGYEVHGIARREQKLAQLAEESKDFTPVVLDISNAQAMDNWFSKQKGTHYDLLINNAGLALGADKYGDMRWRDIQQIIDTNIVGLTHLTWLIIKHKPANRNLYIINMGSIAGTYSYPNNNIYGSSKAFVAHLSSNLRSDHATDNVRVTNIEPGLARTEFSKIRFKGNMNKENALYSSTSYLEASDIASIVEYLIRTPKHLTISHLEILPSSQIYGPLITLSQ